MTETAQITMGLRIRRLWILRAVLLVARVCPPLGRWLFIQVLDWPRMEYRVGSRWRSLGRVSDHFEVEF